eukprot:6492022-Amphidinium_carterae.4
MSYVPAARLHVEDQEEERRRAEDVERKMQENRSREDRGFFEERPPCREFARSDAFHPHLDSEPEWYDDNDSEGTYHSPTPADQTPELDEDVEEEAREQDELEGRQNHLDGPYFFIAPPVIMQRTLPVAAVKRLSRKQAETPPKQAEAKKQLKNQQQPV